jgi:hypothetical protein
MDYLYQPIRKGAHILPIANIEVMEAKRGP